MRTNRILGYAVTMILASMAIALPLASGATHYVEISGFAFSPKNIVVEVGDTVTWTNNDSTVHTATEDSSSWDTGDISGSGGTGSITFDTAANWSYYCKYHTGMKGKVLVNEAPELLNGGVDPASGDRSTVFNFTVTYRDANNHSARFVYVNIDGTNYTMEKVDPSEMDSEAGIEYYYETLLDDGTHSYRFIANDWYVTNSTSTGTTGTVVPEFGLVATLMIVAVIGAVAVSRRGRRLSNV